MTDEIKILQIPFHKDFLAKISARKDEEFEKIKQPVTDEQYIHSILLNWYMNTEMQRLAEEKQKELQRQLRTEITVYSNANLQAQKK